jgi:hypothetical protein
MPITKRFIIKNIKRIKLNPALALAAELQFKIFKNSGSLKVPHRKENILIIQTQYKSQANRTHISISNHFAGNHVVANNSDHFFAL